MWTAKYDVKTLVWTRILLSVFREPEVFENALMWTKANYPEKKLSKQSIHLIPKRAPFKYSFVFSQISPWCLVLKLKIQKNILSWTRQQGPICIRINQRPFWNKVYRTNKCNPHATSRLGIKSHWWKTRAGTIAQFLLPSCPHSPPGGG